MTKGEIAWTRKICKQLENCNAQILPLVASRYMPAGWPDRYISHSLFVGWLEFKGETTEIEPHQIIRIDKLNKIKPGLAFVVRYPGLIQDTNGETWATFETGVELLQALKQCVDAAERLRVSQRESGDEETQDMNDPN